MRDSPSSSFNPDILRAARLEKGLSLEEAAFLSGLHDKSQLSRFERGQVIPLATTLGRILWVLNPEPAILYALFKLSLPTK